MLYFLTLLPFLAVLYLGAKTNKNSVIHTALLNSRRPLPPSSTALCQSFGWLSKVSVVSLHYQYFIFGAGIAYFIPKDFLFQSK